MDSTNTNTTIQPNPTEAVPQVTQQAPIAQPPTISQHPEHESIAAPQLNLEQLRAIENPPAQKPNVEATPEVQISQELEKAGVEHGTDTLRDIHGEILKEQGTALTQAATASKPILPDHIWPVSMPYDQTVKTLKVSNNWDSKTWLALKIQRIWKMFNPLLK